MNDDASKKQDEPNADAGKPPKVIEAETIVARQFVLVDKDNRKCALLRVWEDGSIAFQIAHPDRPGSILLQVNRDGWPTLELNEEARHRFVRVGVVGQVPLVALGTPRGDQIMVGWHDDLGKTAPKLTVIASGDGGASAQIECDRLADWLLRGGPGHDDGKPGWTIPEGKNSEPSN